jgi:hypothetical protein
VENRFSDVVKPRTTYQHFINHRLGLVSMTHFRNTNNLDGLIPVQILIFFGKSQLESLESANQDLNTRASVTFASECWWPISSVYILQFSGT